MIRDLHEDFKDLIKSLTDQNVEFLIVGAHALAFHGVARFTQDLDIWMRRSQENAVRVQRALSNFGSTLSDEDTKTLTKERKFLRFGSGPRRVEILNFLDGCEFDQAIGRACSETLDGVPVAVLGLEDYVATKRASGRPKHHSDLTLLRSMVGRLPGDSEPNGDS